MTYKIIQCILKVSSIFIMMLSTLPCSFAACTIMTSSGKPAKRMADGINILISTSEKCPKNVFDFRGIIKAAGLTVKSTMVANRGYHNPSQGSFSFFELVTGKLDSISIDPGDFFFGHFTTVNENDELTADQGPSTRLMVEAFAWDANKELFNFYELIGSAGGTQWFYRGDSADIYADNTLLHRQNDPANPQFGSRLRCSGCHSAGGPIMKEIHAPHNDWWEPNRNLDFGGRKVNASIQDIVDHLIPPNRLAKSVVAGIKRLEGSRFKNDLSSLSLQEKLRPLFCPVEINFMSDKSANDENNRLVNVPAEFFIDRKLAGNEVTPIYILREHYLKALHATKSHFPETSLSDADHAWLAPVKATSDQLAINHLVKTGLINNKFVSDVLSIDMTNPAFSAARCNLLKYIPNTWTNHWQDEFIQQLKSANTTAATTLINHLTNAAHTPEYHQKMASRVLLNCRERLKSADNIEKLFLLLAQRRVEIKASEISKNKLGQILEPGFRVIFPETDSNPVPGQLVLTDTCEIIRNKTTSVSSWR